MGQQTARTTYLPVYLFLVLFSLYSLFPVAWTFVTSIKPEEQAVAYPPQVIPQTVTLDNYAHVIAKTPVPRYMWNSLLVAAGTVAVVVTASMLAGYAFSRFRFPGDRLLLLFLLVCVMVSGATKVIPLYLMLLRIGQLNTHLGLVLTYSAELIPISVWLMKSYLDAIPRELDEAGLTDGAGRLRVFFGLVVPVSLPGLLAVVLFVFVKASQEFIYAQTFISEPNLKTAPAGLYMFLTEIGVQWSNLAAASLLVVLPVILIFLLLQRWFVSGLTAGAVK